MFCKTQNPKKSETHSLQILLFSILLLFVYKADIRASEIMSLQPGQIFRDCTSCPELIVVNAGTFIMGSNHGRPNQRPAHLVQIKSPFAIGRFEVTFKEWNKCVSSGMCKHKPDDHNWGEIRRPVINVTWNQVNNYLKWLSEFTSNTYRLPSEAEWEYVDKAGTNTLFWWGDDVGVNNANCKDCGSNWSAIGSAPIGSFKPNPFGLFDTTGNVFEWVADCWNSDHTGSKNNGAPRLTGDCNLRVIRGGSFYYFSRVSQSSYRAKNPAIINSYWLGFRVLRELNK